MTGILDRGGITPWPKPMQNLRLTRRNELEAFHPHHVVNAWMGHSASTAHKHYLRVTDADWVAGSSTSSVTEPAIGGVTGGVISAAQDRSGAGDDTKKPRKTRGFEGSGCFKSGGIMPPLGSEQTPKTRGSSPVAAVAVPLAVPSVQVDDKQTAELLSRWENLDAAARADVLAVVRGLAMRSDVP